MPAEAKSYYTIGLMSGSSLDGLDLAYCKFTLTDTWSFELIHSKNAELGIWEDLLRTAKNLKEEELQKLNLDFAAFLAKKVQEFINDFQLTVIDALVSHGHTIYHYPEQGITLQLGDGQTLARLLGLKVINNLRQADIALGGQGAPIVPIGDLHLFKNYAICLNIGGIANLSIKTKDGLFAFDICTANQVLNHYANKIGLPYDDGGRIARSGMINVELLHHLNALDFYQISGPKSLDNAYTKTLIELIDNAEASLENVLATYVEHIAYQISKDVRNLADRYDLQLSEKVQVLVTGGGAFNRFLIERIQHSLPITIVVPENEIVNFKEAIVMAFIGVLKLRNETNVLASVTGARQDTSCGEIFEKA